MTVTAVDVLSQIPEGELEKFDTSLAPDVLTDKDETKVLPCRNCRRACVVTRFASPFKTECTMCRKGQYRPPDTDEEMPQAAPLNPEPEFDMSLEPETLTDKTPTKTVPCRKCHRRCIVTLFATAEKTECNTCRGKNRDREKREVQVRQAHTVNPATLENLKDGLINDAFRVDPHCPFDPEHEMKLVSVVHSANYGPRHLLGYDGKGIPRYEQQTGESVTYQCQSCRTVVSYSTQHPLLLIPQNASRDMTRNGQGFLEQMLGVEKED